MILESIPRSPGAAAWPLSSSLPDGGDDGVGAGVGGHVPVPFTHRPLTGSTTEPHGPAVAHADAQDVLVARLAIERRRRHEARLRAMFEEAEMERLAEAGDGSHDADFPAPDAAAAEDLAPTRLAGPSRAAEPKEWRPSGVGSHPGERKRGSKGSD